jgi:hypothetical protein
MVHCSCPQGFDLVGRELFFLLAAGVFLFLAGFFLIFFGADVSLAISW